MMSSLGPIAPKSQLPTAYSLAEFYLNLGDSQILLLFVILHNLLQQSN